MGNRDGAAFVEQQPGHRLADDVRSPDDHRVEPGKLAQPVLEQHQAAERRAGDEARKAGGEPSRILDVEAIDILRRIDGVDHRTFVDLRRQGQLDEDAVHRIVRIEPRDEIDQLGLGCLDRQAMLEACHARRDRRLALGAHIDLARRILADKNDREARRPAGRFHKGGHRGRHALAKARREGLAVDDRPAHGAALSNRTG